MRSCTYDITNANITNRLVSLSVVAAERKAGEREREGAPSSNAERSYSQTDVFARFHTHLRAHTKANRPVIGGAILDNAWRIVEAAGTLQTRKRRFETYWYTKESLGHWVIRGIRAASKVLLPLASTPASWSMWNIFCANFKFTQSDYFTSQLRTSIKFYWTIIKKKKKKLHSLLWFFSVLCFQYFFYGSKKFYEIHSLMNVKWYNVYHFTSLLEF